MFPIELEYRHYGAQPYTICMPEHFISSSGLRLTLDHVVQEIIRFMQDGPNHRYKITIGTDSERLADNGADFVTAGVVHRIGNGGGGLLGPAPTGTVPNR